MRRYTTPTITLTVEGVDLTGADVYVTFEQGDSTLTIDSPTVTYEEPDSTVSVTLTQAQTGALKTGSVNVQVDWVQNGARANTDIKAIHVRETLMDQVVE